MPREFKLVAFFVMMVVAAFVVCAVTMFYVYRATYGRTTPKRAAYAIAEKAGEEAPAHAKLPTDAALNIMEPKYFRQQGSGEQQHWDLAFENGYTDGLKRGITESEPHQRNFVSPPIETLYQCSICPICG